MNITFHTSRSNMINAKNLNMKFKQSAFVPIYNSSFVERSLEDQD